MRHCLLDVNVMIALHDEGHEHYGNATRWVRRSKRIRLYICPIVENGFLRIYGHPAYPSISRSRISPADAMVQLKNFKAQHYTAFISDTVSLADSTLFPALDGYTPRQLTDIYLLGLAVSQGFDFLTLDRKIPAKAVTDGPKALVAIPE